MRNAIFFQHQTVRRWGNYTEQLGLLKALGRSEGLGDDSHGSARQWRRNPPPFKPLVNDFADCTLSDRVSLAGLDDASETHEIFYAAEMSIREKRPVGLPL